MVVQMESEMLREKAVLTDSFEAANKSLMEEITLKSRSKETADATNSPMIRDHYQPWSTPEKPI